MSTYSIYPGSYVPNYAAREQSLKNIIEQANRELSALQNPQYPTNLTQNFQITPAQAATQFKIVNNLDDVNKEIVLSDTYFVSNDFTSFWIKDSKGNIRSFTLTEIVKKSEKDLIIEDLQNQINELKRGMNNVNNKYNESDGFTKNDESIAADKSTNVQSSASSTAKKR